MADSDETTRGAYDLTMRYLAQCFPEDFALLSLGQSPDEIESLSADLPASERQGDWLARARIGDEEFLLQTEFQTRYSEEKIPAVLDYRVRARLKYALPILSVVIYLTDEGYPGPGMNQFQEMVLGRRQLIFEFEEIALWNLDAERVLKTGSGGLIPLIPLMKGATQEEPLVLAVEAAAKVVDNTQRSNLMTAIAVLGSLKHSGDLIARLIRREEMKESTIYQEILAEGREEGLERGLERGLKRGREEGALIGRIQTCQRLLGRAESSLADLQQKSMEELRTLADLLEGEIRSQRN